MELRYLNLFVYNIIKIPVIINLPQYESNSYRTVLRAAKVINKKKWWIVQKRNENTIHHNALNQILPLFEHNNTQLTWNPKQTKLQSNILVISLSRIQFKSSVRLVTDSQWRKPTMQIAFVFHLTSCNRNRLEATDVQSNYSSFCSFMFTIRWRQRSELTATVQHLCWSCAQ